VPLTRRNAPAITCSCGSSAPVTTLIVDGTEVVLLALPLIFRRFFEAGRRVDDPAVARDLVETTKIYNQIPSGAADRYRDAILREYAAFCEREAAR
jgi:hypothetical protein